MRRRLAGWTAVVALGLAGVSCSSTSPSGGGSFLWSVDGRSYQAGQLGLTYANGSQNTFSGFTCSNGQSVTVSTTGTNIKFRTATYASPGSATAADGFQIVINEGLPAQSGGLVPSWIATAGTLTVTAVDGSHIAGSFDVTLAPNTNSSETGTAHATGTFDVPPFTAAATLCGGVNAR
jgi:hypothetical protein